MNVLAKRYSVKFNAMLLHFIQYLLSDLGTT